MPVVGLIGRGWSIPAPILLLIRILAIVDPDRYSNILVESIRTVFVVEDVFDFVLETVIEELYKSFLVKVGPYGVLLEQYSVRRG